MSDALTGNITNTASNIVSLSWGDFKVILPWSGWILLAGAIGVLIYLYRHPDDFDAWSAKIDKFLIKSGLNRSKHFIKSDIRSKINKISKKINKEAEGLITKGIDIAWVNQDNIESFLKKGTVIVRMRHCDNQDKNIVNATSHYVMKGVLNNAKLYLSPKIQTAIDFAIIKKILAEEKDSGTSTDYFLTNILQPALSGDKELDETFAIIEEMEKKGLFTRILLREVRLMGKKLYPTTPTYKELQETKSFFNFLKPFANHKSGNDIKDWEFVRPDIKIGILFIAQKGKLASEGYKPYITRINKKISRGARNIYLFARRLDNMKAVQEIAGIIKKQNKKVIDWKVEKYYSMLNEEELPSICIILKTIR